MKLTIEKSLTNVRLPREDRGNYVSAKPTTGQIGIAATVAEALGVTSGDYVDVFVAGGQVYISKGLKNDEIKNGCKLSFAGGKVGGDLQFSGAAAWNGLGGNNESNRYFEAIGVDDADHDITRDLADGSSSKAFALEFTEEIAKQEKEVKASKAKTVSEPTDAVASEPTAQVEDEELDVNDFM